MTAPERDHPRAAAAPAERHEAERLQDAVGNRGAIRLLHRATEQVRSAPAWAPPSTIDAARAGVSGAAHDYPHRAAIEASFGARFDTRAHTDAAAVSACRKLGAEAYTFDGEVAFSGQPSLRTAAHEAAHVLQRTSSARAGAGSNPAIGSRGDAWERDADRAADLVASGGSAAHVVASGRHGPTPAVQRQEPPHAVPESTTREYVPAPLIIPDDQAPGAGQMTETTFKNKLRDQINAQVLAGQEDPKESLDVGTPFVEALEATAKANGKSLDAVVRALVAKSMTSADDYVTELGAKAFLAARLEQSLDLMTEHENPLIGEHEQDPDLQSPDTRQWTYRTKDEVMRTFPEVSPDLAVILTGVPNWGTFSDMLKGTIFHAIISAGYVTGHPAPAHPLALVNKRIPGLTKRPDLRNPATGAVIEIKPRGDITGTTQLAAYVAQLNVNDPTQNPPWHEALATDPTENWAPPGSPARYGLNAFGIQLVLEAANNYQTEPGMIYYTLKVGGTPPPVYVPIWRWLKERKFHFEFPRGWVPLRQPHVLFHEPMDPRAAAMLLLLIGVIGVSILFPPAAPEAAETGAALAPLILAL